MANKYEVEGMEVDLMWKIRNETLIIWGDIEGNRKCSEIRLRSYFKNRKMKDSVLVDTRTFRRHNPGDRSPFKGEDEIYTRKNMNYWYLQDLYLDCYE
jgi:hypothetical protein